MHLKPIPIFTVIFLSLILLCQSVYAGLSRTQVSQIAKEITVMIDGCQSGSGAIFQREGNIYSVLTVKHAVSKENSSCLIIDAEGDRYQIDNKNIERIKELDLAVVKFSSSKNYRLGEFNDSTKVIEGQQVYIAGYPAPTQLVSSRSFLFSSGNIVSISKQPSDGYALIYDNSTQPGMSGGAVLDEDGKIIGIHGQGGEKASGKSGTNLGIPIHFYIAAKPPVKSIPVEPAPATNVPTPKVEPQQTDLKKQAELLQVKNEEIDRQIKDLSYLKDLWRTPFGAYWLNDRFWGRGWGFQLGVVLFFVVLIAVGGLSGWILWEIVVWILWEIVVWIWNWLTNLISPIQNTKSNTKSKGTKKSPPLNSEHKKGLGVSRPRSGGLGSSLKESSAIDRGFRLNDRNESAIDRDQPRFRLNDRNESAIDREPIFRLNDGNVTVNDISNYNEPNSESQKIKPSNNEIASQEVLVNQKRNAIVTADGDTEKILDQRIIDKQEYLLQIRQDVAQLMDAVKDYEQQYNQCLTQVQELEKLAVSALQNGDESLARRAIRDKERLTDASANFKAGLDKQKGRLKALKKNLIEYEDEISELKTMHGMLKARLQSAKTQDNLNNMFRKVNTNSNYTYEQAVRHYQDGNYDLLQPYSQGYYSPTSESMRLNREFWGNPLELVEAYDYDGYDGLFWIVQTIEPYFLLLPNPAKKIAKTRLPGFEYFFETNFKSESYISCQVVDPAFMNYANNQWVMSQKGILNFVY